MEFTAKCDRMVVVSNLKVRASQQSIVTCMQLDATLLLLQAQKADKEQKPIVTLLLRVQ